MNELKTRSYTPMKKPMPMWRHGLVKGGTVKEESVKEEEQKEESVKEEEQKEENVKKAEEKNVIVLGAGVQEIMNYKLGGEVEGIELAAQKSGAEVALPSLMMVAVMSLLFG